MGKRIEFVDLMKGICITGIVLYHNSIPLFKTNGIDNKVSSIIVPLFFFLSGMFYKDYGGFRQLLIKKTNNLLIPYVFFAYIPYCLLTLLFQERHGWFYYFSLLIEPHNYSLWFLRTLFMTYVFYYVFCKLTKKSNAIVKVVFLISVTILFYFISQILHEYKDEIKNSIKIYVHLCNICTAVMMLPIFYLASNLRNSGLLDKKLKNNWLLLIVVVTIVICVVTTQSNIDYRSASYGNYILLYVSAISGIVCALCICYKIKRLPYLSYVGRYSLIVLGTHYPYIKTLRALTSLPYWAIALIVLALMPPTIWLFKTLFPHFTGQKELIK